jgi:hypothetical protein
MSEEKTTPEVVEETTETTTLENEVKDKPKTKKKDSGKKRFVKVADNKYKFLTPKEEKAFLKSKKKDK